VQVRQRAEANRVIELPETPTPREGALRRVQRSWFVTPMTNGDEGM